jgi:hypothetical protein
MVMRMMLLPLCLLLGAGATGCTLNLNFDDFEFPDPAPEGELEMGPSLSPGAAADQQEEAPVRCPAGARDCLDDGASVDVDRGGPYVAAEGSDSDGGKGADGADGTLPALIDAGGPRTCDRCTADENCALGVCQSAASSCADLKALDPSLADGIYSIASPDGIAQRTYCDMMARVALCSDEQGDHSGVARDTDQLPFVLTSVLQGSTCKVWNVRAADGRPVDALATSDDGNTVRPCTPLGFKSDPAGYDSNSGCPYGQNTGFGTCGFNVTQPLRKWANLCRCELESDENRGFFGNRYVRQGVIYESVIPWDATGNFFVLCGT